VLTDDQLTDDLTAAFRAATSDLTYAGRVPTPRPSALTALPVLAAAAALVVVPAVVDQRDDQAGAPSATDTPSAGTTASASPSSSVAPAPRGPAELVTETVRLAGYRLSYTRPAGAGQGRLHAVGGVALPADAVEVPGGGPVPGSSAWTGLDAETGDAALFVSVTGDPGAIFELTGPGWTPEQLVEVNRSPEPSTVPLVTR
jgi:hypothetical protein